MTTAYAHASPFLECQAILIDTGDGPIRGFLCENDAEDMMEYLDEWVPFHAAVWRGGE